MKEFSLKKLSLFVMLLALPMVGFSKVIDYGSTVNIGVSIIEFNMSNKISVIKGI